jgi:hypothetical protein
MKNLFIQSFMNENTETFLEVGEKDGRFTSVPTKFFVTARRTCWVEINKKDFKFISNIWNIEEDDVQNALSKQWGDGKVFFIIK